MRTPALIALLMLTCARTLHAAEPLCDRSETRSTPSPDGRWIANVQEEVCATSNGAAEDVSAWAERRKQDPDAAGPRPPRPEEPQLAPGRCAS